MSLKVSFHIYRRWSVEISPPQKKKRIKHTFFLVIDSWNPSSWTKWTINIHLKQPPVIPKLSSLICRCFLGPAVIVVKSMNSHHRSSDWFPRSRHPNMHVAGTWRPHRNEITQAAPHSLIGLDSIGIARLEMMANGFGFTLWWTNMAIEIPIFNRRYIFTRSIFCCHVNLLEGTCWKFLGDLWFLNNDYCTFPLISLQSRLVIWD